MNTNLAEFGSRQELAELLEAIGLRLHAKSRIAGGESGYLWHLAETIRSAGRLAIRADNEPDLHALFGDGYEAGTVPRGEQQAKFLELLRDSTDNRT